MLLQDTGLYFKRDIRFTCNMHCSSGQRILTKGRRPHRMSCRYWGLNYRFICLNDPFAAYSAAEIPNSFQSAGQFKKLPLPAGNLDPI